MPYTGKRILLAEDDASSRTVLAKVLRAMGCLVEEAADGGRMLVAVTSHYKAGHAPDEVDLVITDVRMPVVSGIDVFKGLRAAHWRTPVIIMTGYATKEVRDTAALLGAELLLKPLDLDVFERTVKALLDRPRKCEDCAEPHGVRNER